MNPVYNVLRFKRKVASDMPLDTIVVAPKRSKLSYGPGLIFKYAGIASDDASVEKTLKRALDDSKDEHVPNSKSTESSVNQGKENVSYTSVPVSKKRKIGLDIYMVEFDDNHPVINKSQSNDYDLLTCNGLKMVRNKLSLGTILSYTSDGDDLFDVYYNVCADSQGADTSNYFEPLDLLYIAPYQNDFVDSDDEKDENCLEQSDSNDENYYANDYPDSPGSRSSGTESRDSDFGNSCRSRSHWYTAPYGLEKDDSDNDPTDFFQRYSDHVQSDASLSD